MGFLRGFSSVMAPPRLRADASNYTSAFFGGDDLPGSWVSSLSAAGVNVTPELAMTLSAMYCGVTTISYDIATLPLQTRKYRPNDEGSDPVRGRSADVLTGGITDLAYMLQWAPNDYQTATEFFVGQVAQYLLRGKAYAEIVDGPRGFLSQLLPRHPDRVQPERLPTGRLRYRLTEINGGTRYLTQDEMHVVRDLSTDGLQMLSRTAYGAGALGSALAAERAAGKFFKSGMTASVVATYKGDMEDEDEAALHKSITRYAAGVENTFGLLLIPDDVTIANLGVNPDKAQMMLAREWGAREVARLLRMPPHKLMIAGTQTYASQVQSATDYVVGCLRPIAHTFEQAIQRDLILQKDTYFVRFKLAELLRGDPVARADYYEKAIKNRWMRPSEVRLEEGLNPDPALDALSERDNQPGQAKSAPAPAQQAPVSRASMKALLAVHDNAVRCLRRERAAVEKLARKCGTDVKSWKAGLREFYGEHAGFVAQTMRLAPVIAQGYAAQHGSEFECKGLVLIDGEAGIAWERAEADELAALAIDGDATTVDGWFDRRVTENRAQQAAAPIHVHTPVTIAPDAVRIDAPVTVTAPHVDVDVQPAAVTLGPGSVCVDVQPAAVTLAPGAVHVEIAAPPPADVHVAPPHVSFAKGAIDARTTVAHPRLVKKTVSRNTDKQITGVTEEYLP